MNEPTVSTASEDVERLAHHAGKLLLGTTLGDPVPATLRALAKERDAEVAHRRAAQDLGQRHADERDAARAEALSLRGALGDLISWFPDKPSPPEWRLRGGVHGADAAVEAARAALAQKEPRHD
jgi:hypothetical protein